LEQAVQAVQEEVSTARVLPDDPAELEDAIKPLKVMVRPILLGISRLAKSVDTDPLDLDEIRSGETAWAALMYQYGAMLDARVLVALWCAGIGIPRVVQYMEAQKEKRKRTSIDSGEVVQGAVVRKEG